MNATTTSQAALRFPRQSLHAELPQGRSQAWIDAFDNWPTPLFPQTFGAALDEVRCDYARMSVPYAPSLDQPAGFIHGGVIATLLDTVVVPAIGAAYERPPILLTIDMQIRFLDAAQAVDLVAEGWVVKRGRTIAFCQSEVTSPTGSTVAEAWLTYRIVDAPAVAATTADPGASSAAPDGADR